MTTPAPTRQASAGGEDPGGLLDALRSEGLEPDDATRRVAEYSYDASNYRVPPVAVVFPRGEADVAAAVRLAHRFGVPVTARGGGTGMVGNSIGEGLVLDLSRHMSRVLDVDEAGAVVTAEAGCVLTELRRAVHAATDTRLTFAPDPSSQSRATVGGAVGNDACGNHSVRHGRTADHVVELRLVTHDGIRLTATRSGVRATDPDDPRARGRAEQLEAELRELTSAHLAAFRTELGRIPRQVSGFHLRHLLPEEGFDVARALVGSEGACAVVTAATFSLVPVAARTSLIVVGYPDVVDAARDVPLLLTYRPTAVEGIDERIVETMRQRRGHDAVAELPDGSAWLFVELDEEPGGDGRAGRGGGGRGGDRPLDERVAELADRLTTEGHALQSLPVTDPGDRADLWRVREDGAGLSSRLTDARTGDLTETWPGWEDSAVPPEGLADYLADYRDLLDHHGLTGVMYGHFGAGCMHIRISFDLRSADGVEQFRSFCTDAAHMTVRHGGSLSGEHGDGRARSELLPVMYSDEIMGAFERFADIWDPSGTLNPGGLRSARPMDADLALRGVPRRDLGLLTSSDGRNPVQACIGIGKCRTHTGGVMCPSFRATGDEKDSTRGRARVLQEMVRGDRIDTAWESTEVAESLELCLACKACSTDCPTGVDMATFKSQFLHHHYKGRVRPLAHYSLGKLPTWLRFTPHVAGALNAVLSTRIGKAASRLGGIGRGRTLPRFGSARELAAELRRVPESVWRVDGADRTATARTSGTAGTTAKSRSSATSAEIVLFLDTFTRGLRPAVAGAAARVLGGSHRSVACSSEHCCGLTDITTGRLDTARRTLRATARHLDELRGPSGEEVPIVVVEPSCAAALHHDMPMLLAADDPTVAPDDARRARRVADRIRSAAGHLGRLAADGRPPAWPGDAPPDRVTVQTHCHEYSTFGNRVQRTTLAALGVADVREATGCCGIAGDFGFTAGHEEIADAVAEQALAPALREDTDAPVLTDGFSCAAQVDHLAVTDPTTTPGGEHGRRGRHLFELLDPDPLPDHAAEHRRTT